MAPVNATRSPAYGAFGEVYNGSREEKRVKTKE
jgi:hypothetical protein